MTAQKHLKQRVRARSAKTGESYTAARRHVVGDAAHTPAPLVAGYRLDLGGVHHDTTLAVRVLAHAGVVDPATGDPFTEAAALGLAGGLGFMYASFSYVGHPPTMCVVLRSHPAAFVATLLERAGIAHTAARTGSAARAEAALRTALDAERAALCTLTRSRLPGADPDPWAEHDEYLVAVAGLADGTAWLDEGGDLPRPVPQEVLAAARAAKKATRQRLVTVGGTPPTADPQVARRSAIDQTVGNLTRPVLGTSFDTNFGFRGLQRWATLLRDERDPAGWPRRFGADPEVLAATCGRLVEWVRGRTWAGPGGLRPLYADFLDETAGVLGAAADHDALLEAAGRFRESGRRWSQIASLAAAAAAAGPGPGSSAQVFAAVAGEVDAVVRQEQEAVEALRRVVG